MLHILQNVIETQKCKPCQLIKLFPTTAQFNPDALDDNNEGV